MAKIGVRCLTYATYSSGGEGSAIVYTGGIQMKDYMVRGELTKDVGDVSEYADDHKIDTDTSPTGVHLNLELANMDGPMMVAFAGMKASGNNGEYVQTDEAAPFIGCGYAQVNRFKGQVTYEGVWVHKIQFHQDSMAADTKTQNVAFGHENVTGDGVGVQLTEGGDIVFYDMLKNAASLSAVETWLKGKAGIS